MMPNWFGWIRRICEIKHRRHPKPEGIPTLREQLQFRDRQRWRKEQRQLVNLELHRLEDAIRDTRQHVEGGCRD